MPFRAFGFLLVLMTTIVRLGAVEILHDDQPAIAFGVTRLVQSLTVQGLTATARPATAFTDAASPSIAITSATAAETKQALKADGYSGVLTTPESFAIWPSPDRRRYWVVGADATGAMYGTQELAEQIRLTGGLERVAAKTVTPRFPFRALKFNLPWRSYREHEALQLHHDTCRDLTFWTAFLDMMAENRYNALTLWNLHPFAHMIRPTHFPEACGFNDRELAEWKTFWTQLFRMAKDRGIATYLVNWNIFVSPEFAKAHKVASYCAEGGRHHFGNGDTSELVKRYTKECVTQVIDEYPDLTGLGITLGERMGGMAPQEREDWLLETFGAGMKAAKRPVRFIHRAPLSAGKSSGASTDNSTALITRAGIDTMANPWPMLVEMKFNWSHAFSSPKLCIIHGGKASESYWEPKPTNYQITWMIRNEDFFILRWGDPDFVRQHLAINGHDYVGGYFVGSECYIPAKNYIDRPDLPGRSAYAFQRQWLFYQLWGRLLYDPATPDAVFTQAFDARYGTGVGAQLLPAYAAVSRMPQRLASFYKFSWDFTLYSEGFLAPAQLKEDFISIDDLIKTATLDPSYVSITDYVAAITGKLPIEAGKLTPLALADQLTQDAEDARRRLAALSASAPALDQELVDIRAWAFLSLYFADKLRAGVALQTYRTTHDAAQQTQAVRLLESAAQHWGELAALTSKAYPELPLIHTDKTPFSWARYLPHVQRDIAIAKDARDEKGEKGAAK